MNNFTRIAREGAQKLIDNIKSVIYIQTTKLEYIIASLIAGGHVILADAHGVGKTSLARALAGSIKWETDDMLADRVGEETEITIGEDELIANETGDYTSGDKKRFNAYGLSTDEASSHIEGIKSNHCHTDEMTDKTKEHIDEARSKFNYNEMANSETGGYIDSIKGKFEAFNGITRGRTTGTDKSTSQKRTIHSGKIESISNYSFVKVKPFSRIQCTVDLLPQDILGYNRFAGSSNRMIFNKGPIFAHFILCDEINLLTPKSQGAFLEAMQEQAVTIEGHTYRLPDPFFIIATMNIKGAHLFPLPAPQLDRFMLQLSLGYPGPEDEAGIIKKHGREDAWKNFKPVISSRELILWQSFVDEVEIHKDVIDYIVAIIRQTRYHPDVHTGASPRAGVKLSRMARALSLIRGENFVSIDTVKEIFIPVVAHRLMMKDPSIRPSAVLLEILKTVPVEIKRRVSKSG